MDGRQNALKRKERPFLRQGNQPGQNGWGKMLQGKLTKAKLTRQNAMPSRPDAAELVATRPPQPPKVEQSVASRQPSVDATAEKRATREGRPVGLGLG
jgi:hypothetical protein